MNPTKVFADYFNDLATGIDGVTTCQMSDGSRMERLLQRSVNEQIYPAVFSMRPKYKANDNGAEEFAAMFDVIFYVFCQSEQGNEASEDAAFDQAETIALAILKQIKLDHLTTAEVEFDYNSASLEPVGFMLLDSTQGYEVKMRVGLTTNEVFRNYDR